MKILWIATKLPWPPVDGGRLLMVRSFEALATAGHTLTVVAPDGGDRGASRRAMEALASHVRLVTVPTGAGSRAVDALRSLLGPRPWTVVRHTLPAMAEAVGRLLAEESFDGIVAEQVQALGSLPGHTKLPDGVPVVWRAQNVESDLWRSTAAEAPWFLRPWLARESRRLAAWEGLEVDRFPATLTLTREDRERLGELAPGGVGGSGGGALHHLPAPFPGELPTADMSLPGAPAVVLFGSGGWRPNRSASAWFCHHAWPAVVADLPEARLHVFGPAPDGMSAVERHPYPAESRDAFPPGSILVVPLFVASGVRMKILEAWARGIPVVATATAARGLDAIDGRELLLAGTARDFAHALSRLHREPGLRASIVDAARQKLVDDHAPAVFARRFEAVWADLAPEVHAPEAPWDADGPGDAAFERWLGSEGELGERSLAVLRLFALFDRPASPECLAELRDIPSIQGLTEPLTDLTDDRWWSSVRRLAAHGLLAVKGDAGTARFEIHPWVRDHLAERLRKEQPQAWRLAHGRLFDHLKGSTDDWPEGLEGLQPMYQAVVHGCLAGRQDEACEDVYGWNILRGNTHYSSFELGAIAEDLNAVECFFERPWDVVSPALSEANQAWILNEAAFGLHALGRLGEALGPMVASLDMVIAQEDWESASTYAANLCTLQLALGDLPAALRSAERGVGFAEQSEDLEEQIVSLTTLGHALHQAGRRDEALEHFRRAEAMQADSDPEYPQLESLQGFQYFELLLTDVEMAAWKATDKASQTEFPSALRRVCDALEQRAIGLLSMAEESRILPDIARSHLALGRVRLYRSILAEDDPSVAAMSIESAVEGFRIASRLDELPEGLSTRAWLRALQGDSAATRSDLDEGQGLAEQGPMPLSLVDIALHSAGLLGDPEALGEARRLIDRHGYGRRTAQLECIERTLSRDR